ncbi:hypothetical protein [Pisciglobus halotolerans]|uniref:Uncharacterized protein n=1 Tax=Pisciglobus halotolerans TaxID=745365 RepID=A0A1I3C308_9LACT|nr:hypothetical protein [Pisciglobus halotolerans]SFH68902.1 hypothetical protein SAMN04489868_11264 [Pisciglobus halotolerans]
MNRENRKEAFEQLRKIERDYGSVVALDEGHAELVRLRALYGGKLIADNTEDERRATKINSHKRGRGSSKKTAVYKDGKVLEVFPSLKKATVYFNFPYSAIKRQMKKGWGYRDGYKFVYAGEER